MSKHKIRKDKTCLNCGTFVGNKYCPQCGQQNTESRESFFHLILEFIFDLVHFDSSFWKTTRYLIFSPAKLSLEYMEGKRKSYVNPIKLYIFISFIAFFIPAILPSPESKKSNVESLINVSKDKEPEIDKYGYVASVTQLDSIHYSKPKEERIKKSEYKIYRKFLLNKDNIQNDHPDSIKKTYTTYYNDDHKGEIVGNVTALFDSIKHIEVNKYGKVKSLEHLDSIHNSKAPHERISFLEYQKYKSGFQLTENIRDKHNKEKIVEFLVHNLSKVLFIYMPIFAFWIWIFNLNRRRYYFDSGIFTLHFFSFLLLLITIFNIVACVLSDWLNHWNLTYLVILPIGLLYITFYFFRANRVFYSEKRWRANLKAVFLFIINNVFIIILLVSYLLFAFTRKYS